MCLFSILTTRHVTWTHKCPYQNHILCQVVFRNLTLCLSITINTGRTKTKRKIKSFIWTGAYVQFYPGMYTCKNVFTIVYDQTSLRTVTLCSIKKYLFMLLIYCFTGHNSKTTFGAITLICMSFCIYSLFYIITNLFE